MSGDPIAILRRPKGTKTQAFSTMPRRGLIFPKLNEIRCNHRRWHHGFDRATNLVNLPLA
jgi:hypothetical protein